MKIDSYSFGQIRIDGKAYSSDVIIYADRVDATWWREEGHRLQPEDLVDVLKARPDVLVVGTGFFGVMSVPEYTVEQIRAAGVDVRVEKTGKAVDLFNKLAAGDKRVVAALHLTC
jgi:hypothetical protein